MGVEMLTGKTDREVLVDELLTLALFSLCQVFSRRLEIGDRLKVTKLIFLAAYSLSQRQLKGFNLRFFRYTYGPFTPELYQVWGGLEAAGLVNVAPGPGLIALTEQGAKFGARLFRELTDEPTNEPFTTVLEQTASRHCNETTRQIIEYVYALPLTLPQSTNPMTLAEISSLTYLTQNIPEDKAAAIIKIPEITLIQYDLLRQRGWASDDETAAVIGLHTPEMVLSIKEALEADLRGEGRHISRKELEKAIGIR